MVQQNRFLRVVCKNSEFLIVITSVSRQIKFRSTPQNIFTLCARRCYGRRESAGHERARNNFCDSFRVRREITSIFWAARSVFITFHWCHLLRAIVPRGRKWQFRRFDLRHSTVDGRDESTIIQRRSFPRNRRGGDVAARCTVADMHVVSRGRISGS